MSSAPQDDSPRIWMFENAPSDYQRTYPSDPDAPVHLTEFQFRPVPATLDQQPGPPHDGESAAQFQALPTQVHPNDALASGESQPEQALAESRRLWILKHAPSNYQRIYSSDADTHVHSQAGPGPTTLGQQYLPGPRYDRERAAQLQVLPTQVHPNDALASASQPSQALAESRRCWISKYAPSDYQRIYPSDPGTPVHLTEFQFGPVPTTLDQQRLPGAPHDGESATQFKGLPTQVHLNDTPAYTGADTHAHVHLTEFQFGPVPFTFDQQLPPGPPHDGESPAQPQVWGNEVHPYDASPPPPPGLVQSTGGAQEQSPGTTQSTGAQEAEPHPHSSHSSAASEGQHSCNWANCVASVTRPQDLERHIREVHDPNSPRKCPLCPPDRRPWKRPYLLKGHLISDHHEEFAEDVFEHISDLRGQNVFAFVDTIEPPQS